MSEYHDYVVDFLWRDRKTIAETDGKLKYKSGQDAIRQAKRDTLLQEQGYRVVHITWDDLFRHPQLVVKRILDAFAAISTHLAYLFDHPSGLYPRNASKRGLKRPSGRQDCG